MADRGTPSWPKVTIRLYDAHNGEVKIAGRSHPLVAQDPRGAAIALVAERASQLGRPVKATAVEPDGSSWPLIIHPDGEVDALDVGPAKKPIWPILVAAGVALVLVAGTLVYLLAIRDTKPVAVPPSVSPTLPPLPTPEIKSDTFDARQLPAGFTSTAAWSLDVFAGTNPAVSRDETKLAVITKDRRIAMLGAGGKVIWQDEVPENVSSPEFTKIDGKDVVAAVVANKEMLYWPVNGGFPTKVELGTEEEVRFFGTSPLVVDREGNAKVVAGDKLVPIPGRPRRATILLADGSRALMAGYFGPLWWGEANKEPVEVPLKPPTGSKKIHHVATASPGLVVVMWSTKDPELAIPAVHSTETGSVLATCPETNPSDADWVPDPNRKAAALGTCVIDFASRKTRTVPGFQPLSMQRSSIYGKSGGGVALVAPGAKPVSLADETARPWGIVGGHAIVIHDSVLYALTPKTK